MISKDNYSGFRGFLKFCSVVITWTSLVILILIGLFLAYYTIGNKWEKATGNDFEPFVSLYTIISPSMTPNINVYDVVVAKRVNSNTDIKVGDVITFISTSNISRGKIITHRVIEIVEDETGVAYITKGDNNLSPDSAPAKYDNVIGKVVLKIPQLGRIQYFLASQGGWLIAVVIPALFIIINDILKIFKLTGVKNKIEKMNQDEKTAKKEKIRKEEQRKELLKKRLHIDKNSNEPEPIVTKKNTRIVVAEKTKNEKTKKNIDEKEKEKTLKTTKKRKRNNHKKKKEK